MWPDESSVPNGNPYIQASRVAMCVCVASGNPCRQAAIWPDQSVANGDPYIQASRVAMCVCVASGNPCRQAASVAR